MIRIEKSTLGLLQKLKVQKDLVSYDDVINDILLKYYMNHEPEKVSNEDVLLSVVKNDKQILKRIEALHDRIGYYEKVYFTKIVDIADDIEESILNKKDEESTKYEDQNANEILQNKNYLELQKKYKELEIDYEELQIKNKNTKNKITTLKGKVDKKNIFGSGYNLNWTEEEYNSFFNLK